MLDALRQIAFALLSPKRRFERIYRTNRWNSAESVSGPGSELAATEALRAALPDLIGRHGVQSLLDAPCGDFNWMQQVLKTIHIDYTGIDIVEALIARNQQLFGGDHIRFQKGDIIRGSVPRADLIINRDCFIHLSFKDAAAAIRTFKASGSRLLLASNYPDVRRNDDIVTGRVRFINLALPPYNFPPPIERLAETEVGKEMLLWELSAL